jgi:hypothetical protein
MNLNQTLAPNSSHLRVDRTATKSQGPTRGEVKPKLGSRNTQNKLEVSQKAIRLSGTVSQVPTGKTVENTTIGLSS